MEIDTILNRLYLNEAEKMFSSLSNESIHLYLEETVEDDTTKYDVHFLANKKKLFFIAERFFNFLTLNLFKLRNNWTSDVSIDTPNLANKIMKIDYSHSDKKISVNNLSFHSPFARPGEGFSTSFPIYNLDEDLNEIDVKFFIKILYMYSNFDVKLNYSLTSFSFKENNEDNDEDSDEDTDFLSIEKWSATEIETYVFEQSLHLHPLKYVEDFFSKIEYDRNAYRENVSEFINELNRLKNFINKKGIHFYFRKPSYIFENNKFIGIIKFIKEIKDIGKIFDKIYLTFQVSIAIRNK